MPLSFSRAVICCFRSNSCSHYIDGRPKRAHRNSIRDDFCFAPGLGSATCGLSHSSISTCAGFCCTFYRSCCSTATAICSILRDFYCKIKDASRSICLIRDVQQLLNLRLKGQRVCCRLVAIHTRASVINEKLGEVPLDESTDGARNLGGTVNKSRTRVPAIDISFLEKFKLLSMRTVLCDECADLLMRAGLLPTKLIRGEAKNTETSCIVSLL